MINTMRVSFDFDDTLDRPDVQHFAEQLHKAGYQVWIVTSRTSNERAGNDTWNNDLFFVAECLGIKNIHFCNLQPKRKFFEDNDFLFHLDDDIDDVQDISRNTDTPAVHFIPTIRMEALDKCRDILNKP